MAQAEQALVVDDDPQVRNAIARFLRKLGLHPVVAASGEEALALAEDARFHAVITDVQMPGMGGIALLQRLSPNHQGTRFILVTGCGGVDPQTLPTGHSSIVLSKPWEENTLRAALNSSEEPHTASVWERRPKSGVTRVLVIENELADAILFDTALRQSNPGEFSVTHALSLQEGFVALGTSEFDVVVVDLWLDDSSGLGTLARLQAEGSNFAIVVHSGASDPELALQCVQCGAQDYLIKGEAGGSAIAKALRYSIERKGAELRLATMAFSDQMTGLANRTLFRQRVAEAVARARRTGGHFAVFLLDMDRFKAVNDALGHDAGDAYLQHIAERLTSTMRETDTVARFGGDEFAIVAEPVQTGADVERLSRRILRALRSPVHVSGVSLDPTASIGAALYPDSGTDCDALLSAADAAMYEVKETGRNGFRLHGTELTERIAKRIQLEDSLRRAVKEQRLTMHYQPQYSAQGALGGAEALLRWHADDGSLVPAEDFVAILEECGLIIELGPWIWETACQQLVAWRKAGCPVPHVAINLSARQLVQPDLVKSLCHAIERVGLDASDIELELTETALIHDEVQAARCLGELHERGFRLVLDDFGTGYSSLIHLQRFPIDAIKIDKSFIKDCAGDARHERLVGGIIHLALCLGLDVVAEGVENEGQLRFLHDEGCQLLQGYLLGGAMAPDAFVDAARYGGPLAKSTPAAG